jgi:two-component system NtrC family sensor kinase
MDHGSLFPSAPSALRRTRRHLPDTRRAALVLVAVVAAMGGRAMLDPWLREGAAFLFAWPAVAVVALTAGPAAATLAAALCAAWAMSPWVPPAGTDRVAPALFLATAVALAWAMPWLVRLGGRAPPVVPAGGASDATVHHRVVAALRWIVLLAAVVPLFAFIGIGAWQLQVRSDEAYARMERVTRVAAEHATRVFETNEMLLRRVVDLLGDDDDARIAAREPALHARLRAMTAELPQVQSIWVHDARGHPLLSNRFHPAPRSLDVADREFFAWHRDRRGGLFITEALTARMTGEVFSDLSLRRDRPDGTFAGLASVGLHVGTFDQVHRELARDLSGAAFALLRVDGRWISRMPGPTPVEARLPEDSGLLEAMRAGVPSGRMSLRSPVDGVLRQVVFHRVAGYPVYVAVGVGRPDVLARWRGDMAFLGAIIVPLTIGLVALAWIALRRAEQGLASVERLQSETAQRLRVEAALRQSQKLEALGRLTGGVAHDFNNLLTVVGNNVHLLRRVDPRHADSPQLAAIERAVRTGAQLTRQLLAFSRRQVVRVETIRLQDRLPELLVLVRPMLPPGVDVEVEIAPDTAGIEVDGAEFELAVLNLVGNACDAMPDGGLVRLSARNAVPAEREEPAGPQVVVEVQDGGLGIAPELLPRVFEPFFSTKPHGQGTGLGLAQVMALCRSAGGTARIRSGPGRGTTVTMLFAAAAGAPADAQTAGPAEPPRTLGLRVLLAEDNADVAIATQELLETMGCSVRRVADADAAVEAICAPSAGPAAAPFDVVLSDIAMPGSRDGIALGAWIRAHRPELGVVLMTGYAERLGKAAEQGLPVLPKPCPPAALAGALWDAHVVALARTEPVAAAS